MALGFEHILFTGGEPFILAEISDMLAYSSARAKTTVLPNGTLVRGNRLDRLSALANDNLVGQVSLDGECAKDHDTFRGTGTWTDAVESIELMRSRGIHVSVSGTETPANSVRLDMLRDFVRGLGIPGDEHPVRPLAKRGFSREGVEVNTSNVVPEVTITANGAYWHPLISPSASDLKMTRHVLPLIDAVEEIQRRLDAQSLNGNAKRPKFT